MHQGRCNGVSHRASCRRKTFTQRQKFAQTRCIAFELTQLVTTKIVMISAQSQMIPNQLFQDGAPQDLSL